MSKDPLKHFSKFLSLVLRHQPEVIGLRLDAQGWANVDELLTKTADQGLNRALLEQIVAESDKQRFAFSPDGNLIRANQGHSLPVDLALVPQSPPERLFHGTARRHQAAIFASGLEKRQRQHVHLSADIATAQAVGSRYDHQPLLLSIDSQGMVADGHVFYCSANGVWLSEHIPPEYIQICEQNHD